MLSVLKRYSLAFIFLFIVVILMVLGTLGVKTFGDKMLQDTGVEMKPRGEKIKL